MMINSIIKIYPTKIVIENYEIGSCSKLERSLSVWDPVLFKVVYSAYDYNSIDKKLTIPGGYNINYLEKLFKEDQIQYEIDYSNNSYVEPYRENKFSLKFPPKNNMQINAINFLMKKTNQKFLSLETGGGKTYCAISYAFRSKKLPLTFVDQESMANQWIDRILYFTNIKKNEIFFISGQKSIDKLLEMKESELNKFKWYIAIHRTLFNYINNNGSLELNNFMKRLKIGLRLYDEAHVEYRNIFDMDRSYDCESVYITATPSRSNPNENKVYQNMFSKSSVPKFIGKGEKYHNVIIFKYDTKPDYAEQVTMKSKYGFDVIKWNQYIITDKYDILFDSLTKIFNKIYAKNKHKTAILIKSIELCDKIYNDFKVFLEEKSLTVGRFHSKVKNKENELEKDVIFTTEKSFGKGLDVKGLSVCVNTVPCSSEAMVLQIIGRLREIEDKEVFFIDMYDNGFEMQRKQAAKRLRIYKNKAKKIYNMK